MGMLHKHELEGGSGLCEWGERWTRKHSKTQWILLSDIQWILVQNMPFWFEDAYFFICGTFISPISFTSCFILSSTSFSSSFRFLKVRLSSSHLSCICLHRKQEVVECFSILILNYKVRVLHNSKTCYKHKITDNNENYHTEILC